MSEVTGAALNPRRRWRLASLWPMLFLFLAALYLAPDTRSMRNTYYLLVLLPALVLLRREDFHLLWKNPVLRAASLLLGYLWLSCLWSENDNLGKVAKTGAQLVYLLVFLLVATRCLSSDVRRQQLMVVVVVSAVFGALLSLWNFWELWERRGAAYWLWTPRLTFWGSADHPIIGASLYAMAAIFAYSGSFDSKGWQRIGWLLGGLLVLLVIVRTYSRGPLLALLTIFFIGVVINRGRKTVLVSGLLIAIVVAWVGYQDIGGMLERGAGVRPQIWLTVWYDALNAPLFGHGLLSDESIDLARADRGPVVIDHPHSIFMATLFYGGLSGLILLLNLFRTSLKEGFRLFSGGQSELLPVLLLAFALGVTDNNKLLLSPAPLWLFFWLPIAMVAARHRLEAAPNAQ